MGELRTDLLRNNLTLQLSQLFFPLVKFIGEYEELWIPKTQGLYLEGKAIS